RESLRSRPQPASVVHARQPASSCPGCSPPQVDRRRAIRQPLRQRRRHADHRTSTGLRLRSDACLSGAAGAVVVLRPSPRHRAHSGSGGSGRAEGLRDGRGLAVHSASNTALLRAGGPQDVAEAQRRDDSGDSDGRGLCVGRSVAHHCRKLSHQAAAGEPSFGPSALCGAVSIERNGAGPADRADSPSADPAQTSGPGQSPHSCCRSKELLDLHQHSHRQRTGRRDVSRVRLRGGSGPPCGPSVILGRCYMATRVAVGFVLALTLITTTSHSLSAQAQGTGIREVSASSRTLIPLQTRLRYTTMVVLPEGEEILDVICGDKDFWVISSTHNIAHVKPAKEGAATNMNLVTASGAV